MASPTIDGSNPKMPRQPKRKPPLVVDPVPGTIIGPQLFPAPLPYTPIKKTKAVGKVYRTY